MRKKIVSKWLIDITEAFPDDRQKKVQSYTQYVILLFALISITLIATL